MTSTYTQHVVEDMISTHLLISIAHPHWIGGHFQPLRKYLIDHRSVIFIIIIVFMSLEKNLPKKNRFLSHHCHRAKPSDVLFFLLQLIGKTSFVFLQNNKEIFFFFLDISPEYHCNVIFHTVLLSLFSVSFFLTLALCCCIRIISL